MKRGIFVGTCVLISFSLAGCGSSAKNGAEPPLSTALSSPSSSPLIMPRNLKPQLLTVADLPTGWAIDNSSNGDAVAPKCIKDLKATFHTADHATVSFLKGTDLPDFQQSIGYYGVQAAATTKFSAGKNILDNCRDFSFTADGHNVTGTIGALSFKKLGDNSSAWELSLSVQGVAAGFVVVLVEKGTELSMLLYGDYGNPSLADSAALMTLAVAKMPAS